MTDITPKALYLRRRDFLASSLVITKRLVTTSDPPTPPKLSTSYNNFYEFGTDKGDAAKNSKNFHTKPWSVTVEGLCAKPGTLSLEDLIKPHPLEERVYAIAASKAGRWWCHGQAFRPPIHQASSRRANAKFVEFRR